MRRPDPLQLAPKFKSALLPTEQQLSLAAEVGVPADMISAYVPQREQQQSDSAPAAGEECGQAHDACQMDVQHELSSPMAS